MKENIKTKSISFWGILFLVLLVFIYPISKQPLYITLNSILAFICFLISIFKYGKIKTNWIVLSWCLSLLPILINSYSLKVGEYSFTVVWIVLITYLFSNKKQEDYEAIINVMLIFSMLYIITTLLFNIMPFSALSNFAKIYSGGLETGTEQIAGITSHYSHNAMYICIGFIISICKYISKRKKIYIVYTGMSLIALLLTQKRGPLIAISISLIIFIILNYKEVFGKRMMTALISALIFCAWLYISYIIFPQLFNVLDRFGGENFLTNREYLWNEALKMFYEAPIFGIGWGGYIHKLNITIATVNVTYMFCHNIYLQLLSETGVFGFLIFIYLIFGILFKSIKLLKNKNDNITYFSIIYQLFFIIYGMSGNPLYDKQMLIPYFIAISYAQYIFVLEKEKIKIENWNNNIQ